MSLVLSTLERPLLGNISPLILFKWKILKYFHRLLLLHLLFSKINIKIPQKNGFTLHYFLQAHQNIEKRF